MSYHLVHCELYTCYQELIKININYLNKYEREKKWKGISNLIASFVQSILAIEHMR